MPVAGCPGVPVPDAGCRLPVPDACRCRMPVAAGRGCRMPDARCRVPDAGWRCGMPDAGCRVGCGWGAGCRIGCRVARCGLWCQFLVPVAFAGLYSSINANSHHASPNVKFNEAFG